jgi:uncharacterized membrane protein YgdD (TMEM256/DUF423 family)
MHPITSARTAAVLAALATGLGAFGAHGMKGHFDDSAMQSFETAVRYQMYHALALGLCAALGLCGRRTGAAAICFLIGTVLFSGSIYGLVFLQARWLGPVTPLGGTAFLVGWILLAVNGARSGGDSTA